MAQFVTHIQPTLIEASQGHVPHHHGHQVGVPHTSHLPHSGHNMPSPPTHHGHSHGHVHGHHHHGQGGSLVHSASRDMSNAKGSAGHKAPTHLPLSPKADDQHHHQPHYQHVEGYYQHAPMHYYQQQQHHHGHSHGHHHSGNDGWRHTTSRSLETGPNRVMGDRAPAIAIRPAIFRLMDEYQVSVRIQVCAFGCYRKE
uniref:Uncharacterized protein n=1 Tax=Anopheles coluzzii TaxID=1518534 RepID=A0A8W7Q1P3_ANOCL